MDERRGEGYAEALPEEYSELGNPRLVIEEVLQLLGELHRDSTRLGDTIVTAGLPGREWRSKAARLDQISEEFPPITLDELLTRLAEFAAGTGILWLHGGPPELDRFQDETVVLHGVVKPLRSFAQRQRLLPARERSTEPLWMVFGDPLVSMPLDLVAKSLSDLDALGPFLAPLGAADWKEIDAKLAKAAPPVKKAATVKASAATSVEKPRASATPPSMAPVNSPPVGSPGLEEVKPAGEAAPAPKRLREYLPSAPAVLPRAKESRLSRSLQAGGRYLAGRWLVVLTVAVMLALATGLLTVISQGRSQADAHLSAAPTSATLACTGKTNTLTLTLKNTGTRSETWKVTPPKGVILSAVSGTLAPKASTTVKLTVASGTKTASRGTLTFTDADGSLNVPYTITCG